MNKLSHLIFCVLLSIHNFAFAKNVSEIPDSITFNQRQLMQLSQTIVQIKQETKKARKETMFWYKKYDKLVECIKSQADRGDAATVCLGNKSL